MKTALLAVAALFGSFSAQAGQSQWAKQWNAKEETYQQCMTKCTEANGFVDRFGDLVVPEVVYNTCVNHCADKPSK